MVGPVGMVKNATIEVVVVVVKNATMAVLVLATSITLKVYCSIYIYIKVQPYDQGMCFSVGQNPHRQDTDKSSHDYCEKETMMIIIIWDSPTAMYVEVIHTTSKAMEIDDCCNIRQVC